MQVEETSCGDDIKGGEEGKPCYIDYLYTENHGYYFMQANVHSAREHIGIFALAKNSSIRIDAEG